MFDMQATGRPMQTGATEECGPSWMQSTEVEIKVVHLLHLIWGLHVARLVLILLLTVLL